MRLIFFENKIQLKMLHIITQEYFVYLRIHMEGLRLKQRRYTIYKSFAIIT